MSLIVKAAYPAPPPNRRPRPSFVAPPCLSLGFAIPDCERAFKEVGYELDPVLNWLFSNS